MPAARTSRSDVYSTPGLDDLMEKIEETSPDNQPALREIADWAQKLEALGVAMWCYHGRNDIFTVPPRLPIEDVGLVTIWVDSNGPYIQFWRSVFERRAPESLPAVEVEAAPARVGQGTSTREITDALLDHLTEAYREAL